MMTLTMLTRALARYGATAVLTLPFVPVDFARASEDEGSFKSRLSGAKSVLSGAGSRVKTGFGSVKNGVGAVGTRLGDVGAKAGQNIGSGLQVTKTKIVGLGGQVGDAGSRLTASCADLLGKAITTIDHTLAHNAEPWPVDAGVEDAVAEIWRTQNDPTAAMRQTLRVVFEHRAARLELAINLSTLAQTDIYQKTVGRVWTPEVSDYSEWLHEHTGPRFGPGSLPPAEFITLARELGVDFDQRFDAIRSGFATAVAFSNDTWFPLPSHVALKAARWTLGPYLEHRTERSAIGAQWEVARLIPVRVREELAREIETYVETRPVPEFETQRLRRFAFSGEFDRVADWVERLQKAGLLHDRVVGAEELLLRSIESDGLSVQTVRRELKKLVRKADGEPSETYRRATEVIGESALASLGRLFRYDEYADLGTGETVDAERAARHFETLLRRFQWVKLSEKDRDAIEVALATLRYASLPKAEFIEKLEPLHDNEFKRVVVKSFLPDFLTDGSPRNR